MTPYLVRPDLTVHCGDCLEILPTLVPDSVDGVVTSPPYAMQRAKQYGGIPETEYPEWTVAWLAALRPALKERGSVLINIREHVKDGQISDYVHRTRLAVRAAGWTECDELVWVKPDAPPVGHPGRPRRSWERILWFSPSRQPWCDPRANGTPSEKIGMNSATAGRNVLAWVGVSDGWRAGIARQADVFTYATGTQNTPSNHPAAYPVSLAAWCIRLVCPPGGVVCDPFAGSGTTMVAARALGCRSVGIERSAAYCRLIGERLQQDVLDFGEGDAS